MKLRVFLYIIFLFVGVKTSFGQSKSEIYFDASGIYSTPGELMPLYQYSNNWGIISPFQESNFFLHAGGHYQFLDTKNIELKVGASAIIKNVLDESILHQAYLRGKAFKFLDFTFGKEAYTPVSYNDTLTIGGFLNNSNARPIPKIMLGIYDYVSLPFTKGWVEVRGGISHGWLNDDRTAEGKSNSADMPYLHEKWAYLRLGNTKIQPYAGLVHNSIFGGTRPNGDKIPVDYLSTILGKGSAKLGGGEETNAAGAHEGFWDFGVYASFDKVDALVYIQRPFADGSGFKTLEFRNHDFKIGAILELKNLKLIKNLSLEFIKTDHQAGPGLPDPLYPPGSEKSGQGIFLDQIDDFDIFMSEVFNESTHNWTAKDVLKYLEENLNYGYPYGGRNNYNNNGSYYNGWTYYKQSFGMPLYHTKHQTSIYAPQWNTNDRGIFVNNRIRAIHLGAQGDVLPGLKYLIKYTYSINYGSYFEEYHHRYSWVKDDDYFFESEKNQNYAQLLLTYKPAKNKKLLITSSFSFDFGELYNSAGVNIGLKYTMKSK